MNFANKSARLVKFSSQLFSHLCSFLCERAGKPALLILRTKRKNILPLEQTPRLIICNQ